MHPILRREIIFIYDDARARSNYNNTLPTLLIHLIRYFTALIREMINFASTARVPPASRTCVVIDNRTSAERDDCGNRGIIPNTCVYEP